MKDKWPIQRSSLSRGYKPIAGTDDSIILYHEGVLYRANSEGKEIHKIMSLVSPTWKDKQRTTVRLFRREPKAALLVDHSIFIAQHRRINLIDLNTKTASIIATADEGFTDPLGFCCAQDTEHVVLWGEYGSNERREAVRIYGMTQDRKVDVVYSFSAGKIRHIHNIIPANDGGYYIFTGDEESEAGIYHADKLFQSVQPIVCGSQQYRAVVGFDTDEGLLYATDAVNEPNYVYCQKKTGELMKVCQLNGSCIYGIRYGNGFLFSTTVEPDECNRGPFSWVSYKRGKGILSNEVHLVHVDEKMNSMIVARMKKDWLPMKLFQYGSIQFASGTRNKVWMYPVAVRKNDACTYLFDHR